MVPIGGGRPLVDLIAPLNAPIRFHPKTGDITLLRSSGGASNIRLQPLKGGPPSQLTKFKKGVIQSFDGTPEGKLVMTRGEVQADVSNFR